MQTERFCTGCLYFCLLHCDCCYRPVHRHYIRCSLLICGAQGSQSTLFGLQGTSFRRLHSRILRTLRLSPLGPSRFVYVLASKTDLRCVIPSLHTHDHSMPPHPTSPHPTPSHLTPPHPISPDPTSPHPTPPHPTPPHLTSSCLMPSFTFVSVLSPSAVGSGCHQHRQSLYSCHAHDTVLTRVLTPCLQHSAV